MTTNGDAVASGCPRGDGAQDLAPASTMFQVGLEIDVTTDDRIDLDFGIGLYSP